MNIHNADLVPITEIMRKTHDGEETFWLLTEEGWAFKFDPAVNWLYLRLNDGGGS